MFYSLKSHHLSSGQPGSRQRRRMRSKFSYIEMVKYEIATISGKRPLINFAIDVKLAYRYVESWVPPVRQPGATGAGAEAHCWKG
ncbi:hypothetical protein EVAR_92193_1 [Eumeta japonica]|uniref:Uncharacterized protein n=1 Tax=Eumeta variegata TaxID=151549 RepID=A0A4C1S8N2_EUMVA|nr:hypothetical protein EVAR_92193_1 [Eumeta japonica]